mmetsp:Transcript_122148/g.341890  ORF Transcript_122148/g.341890 Transcript_122148/m.341890 type:complete len:229 (+) Transcript_122148:97-783(+)
MVAGRVPRGRLGGRHEEPRRRRRARRPVQHLLALEDGLRSRQRRLGKYQYRGLGGHGAGDDRGRQDEGARQHHAYRGAACAARGLAEKGARARPAARGVGAPGDPACRRRCARMLARGLEAAALAEPHAWRWQHRPRPRADPEPRLGRRARGPLPRCGDPPPLALARGRAGVDAGHVAGGVAGLRPQRPLVPVRDAEGPAPVRGDAEDAREARRPALRGRRGRRAHVA